MRIVILGNSGSGKSTLARRLGHDLGIPCFHMDRLYWKPGWVESNDDELRAKVQAVLAGNPQWVIDGNYSRVLPERLARADVALLLDVPVAVSLLRAGRRWLTYMGRTRPDMGEGCREKWTFDAEFFKWILTWPKRKQKTYTLLAAHPHLEVRVLGARVDYAELLDWLSGISPAAAPSAEPPPPRDSRPSAAR
jgi:adenylate kinase family enzyme